jgi:hypothetical protein
VEALEIPHNQIVRTTMVLLGAAALLGTTGAAAAQKHQSSAARFRASVTGATRTPFAGLRWRYSVRALNASGGPVQASALVRVLVDGRPLDTIGQFGLKGTLRRSYRWSTTLRGIAAVLQAKVTGPGGTRTVKFAVRIRSYSGKPAFKAAVGGGTRTPLAGARWPFWVRATDSAGHGVPGTAIVRVLVHGKVVDTVGWFGFKGSLRKTYHWSPTIRGQRALLQVSVVGPGGTRTVAYAVRVH